MIRDKYRLVTKNDLIRRQKMGRGGRVVGEGERRGRREGGGHSPFLLANLDNTGKKNDFQGRAALSNDHDNYF